MRRLSPRWTLLSLSALSTVLLGQSCAVTPGPGGGDGIWQGPTPPDPLASLTEPSNPPDPLASLVDPPRGRCGVWTGTFAGTRSVAKTKHLACPWLSGGVDTDDERTDERHNFSFQVKFVDVWSADVWGTQATCAPAGASRKASRTDGMVEYTDSWTLHHDWGDNCRTHDSTVDDTFAFNVKPEQVTMSVEVHPRPYTYSEQQAILAERPCRTEYPVLVTLMVSAPDSGGAGTHVWTERSENKCPACDNCPVGGPLEWDGREDVETNYGSAYTALLYGTYVIDADGNDTIIASYKGSALVDPQPGYVCPGTNDDCTSECKEILSEDYTLTLARSPEGDRDMDAVCDNLDPCPDDAFENECE